MVTSWILDRDNGVYCGFNTNKLDTNITKETALVNDIFHTVIHILRHYNISLHAHGIRILIYKQTHTLQSPLHHKYLHIISMHFCYFDRFITFMNSLKI